MRIRLRTKEYSYYINSGGSYGWGGANSNAQKVINPATGASAAVQDKSQEGKGEEGANFARASAKSANSNL
ncbi:hypothetical protein [Pseudomonas indica]|uniref:Filamentous hemagglutinin n=1 Tax=Pseudomonas indica TaxID=137658 RepID=A0A1G9MFC3_9PSED|nr:hypothetical protein [Pseudomonas indica]SDL72968.1 filamentous hemagglutinin [Pseudomonas indica]